jgi:hypothetical protein
MQGANCDSAVIQIYETILRSALTDDSETEL